MNQVCTQHKLNSNYIYIQCYLLTPLIFIDLHPTTNSPLTQTKPTITREKNIFF